MTELRPRMLEELQRRNFAPSTIRYYIRSVRDFAAYFHKSPDQLGAEQLRQFRLHMLRDQKLATGTVENRMTSLHFFFKKVLKRYDPELYDMQLSAEEASRSAQRGRGREADRGRTQHSLPNHLAASVTLPVFGDPKPRS